MCTAILGVHISRGLVYLNCDARVKKTKHYKPNKPGSSQSWYQSHSDRSNPSWSSLGCFEKLIFKVSNEFESLSKFSDFTPYLS